MEMIEMTWKTWNIKVKIKNHVLTTMENNPDEKEKMKNKKDVDKNYGNS